MIRKTIISLALTIALIHPAGIAMAGIDIDVDINLKVPPPPPLLIHVPPMMIPLLLPIPGATIYIAPELPDDLIFHDGYWYRQREHQWFRSSTYNGEWDRITPGHVPKSLRKLPENFKDSAAGQPRISYKDLQDNWKKWDDEDKWRGKKSKGRKRANASAEDDDTYKGKGRGKGNRTGTGRPAGW